MRAITRRAIGVAAGVGSFTAAIAMGGIGTAQAYAPANGGGNNGGGNNCAQIGVEHSFDGGKTWTKNGRMDGPKVPTVIKVRLLDTPKKDCEYNVSLSSYSAEGPSWENSGHQDFLGWDTVTLDKKKTSATLDVSAYAPHCFGQIDLYGNGIKYDGGSEHGHGALPHYPNSATPTDLITAWNGGHKCDTPPTTPPPTTDTPTTPPPTTDTPTTPPPTTDTPTTTPPTVGDTSSPTPTPSATGPSSTTPPTGSPTVPPATAANSGGNLAETGGNGSQNVAFAGGGAALLVVGGAAVYFTRRRRSGAHS